jgi:hypothetical protein
MAQQTDISKMETTQTAVEWLWNEIDNLIPYQDINKAQQFNGLLEQAIAMEKEQIIDFAMQMHKIDCSKTGTDILLNEAELYYNETYNKSTVE